jgi:hypothetical protein
MKPEAFAAFFFFTARENQNNDRVASRCSPSNENERHKTAVVKMYLTVPFATSYVCCIGGKRSI